MKGYIKIFIIGLLLLIGAIAIIFIGYFYGKKFILLTCCLLPIICYVVNLCHKQKELSAEQKESGLENMINLYGEPEDIIVINPTKPKEKGGVILIYEQKGGIVVDGKFINKKDITNVELKNAATPYTANDYQIIISTICHEMPYLFVHLGNDTLWADNVYKQIVAYLHN